MEQQPRLSFAERIQAFFARFRKSAVTTEQPKGKPKWEWKKSLDQHPSDDLEAIAGGLGLNRGDNKERLSGGGSKKKRHPGAE